jgi:hypothetical protein
MPKKSTTDGKFGIFDGHKINWSELQLFLADPDEQIGLKTKDAKSTSRRPSGNIFY